MFDKKTVFLVVDDFGPMRTVTLSQLRALGANTILSANDGVEALRLLRKQRVDIVLSDWNMPVMSGLELLRTIRSDERLSTLPFIMITAEAERERVAQAIACGVTELMVKPYTPERLAARIEAALHSRPRPPREATAAAASGGPVELAVAGSAPGAKAPEAPASREPLLPTILIVDDAPDNLSLLSLLFEDDYHVRVATNGEKALAICQSSTPPDLVLLDVMMPDIDGFTVARRMREHPGSDTIPVIFVTAMTEDDARLKGLELGAVDFVTKPIDPEVLKPRVRNFLRYVELHKQLQAEYDGMLEAARLREDVEHMTRHDLKGPLAGVIGLVQALADDAETSDKQRGKLRMVEETALQVLNMINLSTELFKIETGRFKLEARPVPILDILARIVDMSRATYAEKHFNICVDSDIAEGEARPEVLGDAMFCYSLFHNLIKNACEAAPEKSRILVKLQNQAPLRISIQNSGAVPAEIRTRFFDKFVTTGKQSGTGIGTYSPKLLTEAQGGKIELEVSDEANTTSVTVILPRAG